MTQSSDWSMSMVSGGKPLWLPSSSGSSTKFSSDGKYTIILMTHEIRVYFIGTRQCIRTIKINLTGAVDSVLDPSNGSQILIFYGNGEMSTVNWKEKVSQPIIATTKFADSANALSLLAVNKNYITLITGKKEKSIIPSTSSSSASTSTSGSSSASIHTRHIIKINRETSESQEIFQISNVVKFAISLSKRRVCFLTSGHECTLVRLEQGEEQDKDEAISEVVPFAYRSPITSLAVSNDSIIAIGTMSGAIQVIYGDIKESKTTQRLLKWHIDQVKSLQFSPDNNYLLSGGLEKVLVFWQLETEKTQFLPRLNGTIEKISIDLNKSDYYSLMLKIPSNNQEESSTTSNTIDDEDDFESSFEVLILSAVDLVSRLSVNGVRPKFSNSNIKSTLNKTRKKFAKLENYDVSKLKHDYTSIFEIHPQTQQLYFPRGATIQGYDLIKNEQTFTQNAAPLLSTGKVRSENKLIDPEISNIAFSHDGQWMCTFDTISTSKIDNLLSKNDLQYALKFWKYIDNKSDSNTSTTGHWELSTKIIDPHGRTNPILSITAAPLTYHNGLSFLTADDKGGLRVWRPRAFKEQNQQSQAQKTQGKQQQTAWTLRKSKPSGAFVSNAVSSCWSEDGSIIVLGHECSITAFNTHNLEEITEYQIPAMSGSRIRSLSILGNYLIVLSKTRITSFDLLSGTFTPFVAKVNTTLGGKNLIAIDRVNELICLAVNYYKDNGSQLSVNSKIFVFKPNQLAPVFTIKHDQGISSIRQFRSLFIFVDLDSRIGVVSRNEAGDQSITEQENLTDDMNKMLLNAQAAADIVNNRNVTSANVSQKAVTSNGNSNGDELQFQKVIDVNTFQSAFTNMDGVQIDTLFERIIKIIK